ncbi:hypothetical protein GGS20DRAFT_561531 [Poronia punctata]|nr:hypothetical protein GGS20DRAFT_561531 [Poronia punctata]
MYARPFFVHPYANVQERHRTPTAPGRRPVARTPSRVDSDISSTRLASEPNSKILRAEMKVHLATNQLNEQIKESVSFWTRFHDEYSTDVDSIRRYIGHDMLQKIWRMKVDFNNNHGKGRNKEQIVLQSMKLESCLSQVDEAIRVLVRVLSYDRADYDIRQSHWEKVRSNSRLVMNLSMKSTKSEAACKGLLEELSDLRKLIDSEKGPNTVDRPEKRRPQPGGKSKSDKDARSYDDDETEKIYQELKKGNIESHADPMEDSYEPELEDNDQDNVDWQEDQEDNAGGDENNNQETGPANWD